MDADLALASARWFKSSFSSGAQGCVEAAFLTGGRVAVRDSKSPSGPAQIFPGQQWRHFLTAVRGSEFPGPVA